MGSLAFWGGVAGAGKGMVANAAVQAESQAKDLEYAREQTLRKLEHEYAGSREAQRQAFEKEQGDTQFRHEAVLAVQRAGFQSEDTAKRIASTEREGAADRANRLDVAKIRASSVGKHAGSQSGSGDWDFSKLKTGDEFDERGRLKKTGGEVPIVSNKRTGATYRQHGDKFFLTDSQGNVDPSKAKPAPREALRDLVQNPTLAQDFYEAYGFLPLQWYSALQSGTSTDDEDEN